MNTENNKKIAEFLGWKEQTDPTERWFGNFINPLTREYHKELYFDIDWNCLMEVVTKIFKKTSINHLHGDLKDALISGDINTTYSIAVAFIDWYNKTQNGAKEN